MLSTFINIFVPQKSNDKLPIHKRISFDNLKEFPIKSLIQRYQDLSTFLSFHKKAMISYLFILIYS